MSRTDVGGGGLRLGLKDTKPVFAAVAHLTPGLA